MSKPIDANYIAQALKFFKNITNQIPHDLILVAGIDKREVPAHCLLMKVASKCFAALLGPHFAEDTQSKVTLDDIDGETLKAIVDYCYSGRIEVNDDNADRIIAAASRMEFPDIEEIVGQYWSTKLSVGNCLDMLALADKHSLQKLWKTALIFFTADFDQLPLPKKLNMDGKILVDLLKCEEIKVIEEEVFTFVVAWVEQDEDNRAKFVPDLIKLIRLNHIRLEFLRKKVESFFRKYTCSDLVEEEYRIRMNIDSDVDVDIKLSRSITSEIFSVNWSTLGAESERKMFVKTYNFNSNQWEHFRIIPLPVPYDAARATISNGKLSTIYYSPPDVHVLLYDLNSLQELQYQHKSEYREFFNLLSIGKYIYVIGGMDSDGFPLRSCERFDTDENRWEQVQSIPEDSLLHAAVEFNGRIYVLSPLSLFCYDPETDEWTKHEFNEGCYLRKIFNSNHNIFVVTYSCALYWFDPINIIWTKIKRFGKDENIYYTIECRGAAYVLLEDGRFGTENLETFDSFTLLSRLQDERKPDLAGYEDFNFDFSSLHLK